MLERNLLKPIRLFIYNIEITKCAEGVVFFLDIDRFAERYIFCTIIFFHSSLKFPFVTFAIGNKVKKFIEDVSGFFFINWRASG